MEVIIALALIGFGLFLARACCPETKFDTKQTMGTAQQPQPTYKEPNQLPVIESRDLFESLKRACRTLDENDFHEVIGDPSFRLENEVNLDAMAFLLELDSIGGVPTAKSTDYFTELFRLSLSEDGWRGERKRLGERIDPSMHLPPFGIRTLIDATSAMKPDALAVIPDVFESMAVEVIKLGDAQEQQRVYARRFANRIRKYASM